MPVPKILQVRCLETDELFNVDARNERTTLERGSSEMERAVAMQTYLREALAESTATAT